MANSSGNTVSVDCGRLCEGGKGGLKGKSVGLEPRKECRLAKDTCIGILRSVDVRV